MTAAERVRAPRLRPGDRVAVVAPSGPLTPERLDRGLDVLRGWDLDPVAAPHARDTHPTLRYLAAADEERARDLQEAWCDPAVKAVFAARGGYGAQRMVDLLDWDAVRAAAPKPLVGFSDVTVLHEAFAVRAGVSTLHGPAVAGEVFLKDDATREHLRRTLFAPETVRTLASPTARPLVPGRARGVTLGGCLTMLATEVGTPRARRGAAGGLLLLEDIGEPPYRLDRALTQLLRAGWLDGVAGIVLGSWAGCGPYDRVREVLRDRLGGLGVPVAEEFGFGHGDSALTLPLGVPAELDATAGTLLFERPATV
ncbi:MULTISPECIES: LD-carboxypeptidase [unclassified Streptomyces]|uniref:S66 peptidase family protein n=1 Tax=unclassified Streptomyces TaxID=2593676 RepID=UPI0008860EAF|nr:MULTISPECIES: LD-carboxypeptidase [unclassified Streptomyces]PBC86110.1 muramoyltetrapeptide carboxypeptidase [Streptomyces sp. 2321.6]SDQ95944.1 muramoyltetrapeptide carboxypeptidase [Streptomyces sp. KS_16]SED88653.1 muramoyltetrapeptide carboxypeptidase [Streptomyces sp. 2133.1]SNC72990.1 muramoyltetrapeptide carboxypeptidase [Streptomyces sp. 2114.4]